MPLPEAIFSGLKEGRLPKRYTGKSLSEIALHRIRDVVERNLVRAINTSSEFNHALFTVFKPVVIKSYSLSGYMTTIDDIYLTKYGENLIFSAMYKSERTRPLMAKVHMEMRGIGEIEKTVHVLFMPHAYYYLSLKYTIEAPSYILCRASVESEYGYRYDYVSRTYRFGILDDRYKPVEEYPVPDADNVILDIAYDWKPGNYIYPQPLPSGLSFTNLSVNYVSGFTEYEGKQYKDPRVDNRVRVAAKINNNTGSTVRVAHWGFPLSVLYEDNRHVSQVDVAVSFPTRTISNGDSYSYSIEFNLPEWCYGKVAAAHALSFYKDENPIYYGGPLYQFEVFRLRLP